MHGVIVPVLRQRSLCYQGLRQFRSPSQNRRNHLIRLRYGLLSSISHPSELPQTGAIFLLAHQLAAASHRDGFCTCYNQMESQGIGKSHWHNNAGFLYFVGRRDNLIKSSGFRVSPTDVEEALCRTGKLAHAAVIGVPDDVLGQAIKAFVVPKPDKQLNLDQLSVWCAQEMPSYMVPKTVEVLRDLPKTTSGKVNYQALRARESLSLT